MKSIKKTLLLLFTSIVLLLLLASCGVSDKTDPSGSTSSEETTGAEKEPPLNIVENGATVYKIVRPEQTSDGIVKASLAVRDAFASVYGIQPDITTDFEPRDFDVSQRYSYEILIGATNRDESANTLEKLSYLDYTVSVAGSRIVIMGGSDTATEAAVEYFISNYMTGNTLSIGKDNAYLFNAEYPISEIKIADVPISDYTLVCPLSYRTAVDEMAARIGKQCGVRVAVVSDNAAETDREIIIGSSRRGASNSGLEAEEFKISGQDGKIYIAGGSAYAVERGCAKLLELMKSGNPAAEALNYTYDNDTVDRQSYIDDISTFIPNWAMRFETPEWMLDYEEKYASMLKPDGRVMSCLHRGDMQYYPENSAEGMISAVLMGADMVEIDPRRTKDGVIVLLHDDTLSRTTNASEFIGKAGFPATATLTDWTYEQLKSLRLKDSAGNLTAYKIPTLEEAIKVCANRLFIRLDVKIVPDYGTEIWPLEQKYNSYSNIIFTWHSQYTANNFAAVKEYKAKQLAAGGKAAINFYGAKPATNALAVVRAISSYKLDPCVRLTDYNMSTESYKTYLSNNKAWLNELKGQVRMYIDAHLTSALYPENTESPKVWDDLADAGINLLLVNKGLPLCMYIAENK